tara:strand:- start:10383 stop:10586 length:204 start_codon:yes stop_codon:yes gene_type:complete
MKKPLSVFELHRIIYINNLMSKIHDRTNSLYESLMDNDFSSALEDIHELKTMLEDAESSLDEVSKPR